ncbi:MAG TPA: hypothetical protein VFR03_21100 [Thermoanaerobaculia bacterium]|nr:hypothetical protein [Thermoanaerobaculia bacterium]
MTEPFRPTPMPFLVLLDEAMRRLRTHLRAIFPAVALPVAVLTTLLQVVQILSIRGLLNEESPPTSMSLFWTPWVLVGALILGVVSAVAYMAGQVAALDALSGRPVDMGRAWYFASRPRVWWTLFLSGLAIFVSVLACVLPVLYVAPLLSFAMPAMVEEGVFGAAALSRSAELTRYNPSRQLTESPIVKILVLMLVTTLISYLAGLLVALPFQLPMFIDIFRHALSGDQDVQSAMARWLWLQVPAVFLSSLVRVAVYLYTAFGIGMLFFDVRGRKEGSDLRSQIDSVFGGPPPSAPELPLSSAPPPGEPWP